MVFHRHTYGKFTMLVHKYSNWHKNGDVTVRYSYKIINNEDNETLKSAPRAYKDLMECIIIGMGKLLEFHESSRT